MKKQRNAWRPFVSLEPMAWHLAGSVVLGAAVAVAWPVAVRAAPLTPSQGPSAKDEGWVITSLAASSQSARGTPIVFQAGYAAGWIGQVQALNVGTGGSAPSSAWGNVAGGSPPAPVSTATLIDAPTFDPAARAVFSASGGTGIPWRWNRLSLAQQTALSTLDGQVDALGEARLAYLRGDRRGEAGPSGGSFRARRSRQGDIVNSRLWFDDGLPDTYEGRPTRAARPAMLYVGGNDGMLHGFAASTGAEQLAYVPEGLHPRLAELTRPAYEHRYFVDGSPLLGDVRLGERWHSCLVGFLGAGGRGYFVLDVTDPAPFPADRAADLVLIDNTADASLDPDVGHIVSAPVMVRDDPSATRQVTQLNDGRWALVTGNGYNSPNERAVLLIQYLDGARELRKLVAGDAQQGANGLGAPRLVDLDGDRIPDVAYAGDLAGRLWRFDLAGRDPGGAVDAWGVAFGGLPLFVATDAAGNAQPITVAPLWLAHPGGGLMLVFGTGRDLTDADRAATAPQSIYGVHDTIVLNLTDNMGNTDGVGDDASRLRGGTPIAGGRASLVEQAISAAPTGTVNASGAPLWTISSRADTAADTAPRRGWYIDLPVPGERVLDNPQWFEGRLVDIATVVPSACGAMQADCQSRTSGARRFINTLNGVDGAAPRSPLYAYSPSAGSSQPGAAGEKPPAGTPSRIEGALRVGIKGESRDKGVCPPGKPCEDRATLGRIALRPSWRLLH